MGKFILKCSECGLDKEELLKHFKLLFELYEKEIERHHKLLCKKIELLKSL